MMTVIVCQMLGRSATAIPAVAASQIQMGPFGGMIWIMICKKMEKEIRFFYSLLVGVKSNSGFIIDILLKQSKT